MSIPIAAYLGRKLEVKHKVTRDIASKIVGLDVGYLQDELGFRRKIDHLAEP